MRVCLLAIVLAGAASTAGCPGSLEDPARFLDGGAGGECTPADVEEDLFVASCSGSVCHSPDANPEPAAGLDLVSPDVAARVVGVEAQNCPGEILVDPDEPSASYLLEKLGPSPACGSQMPAGAEPLSAEEQACVERWVDDAVGASP